MASEVSEADWKILRQLHPIALERFYADVLDEVGRIAADPARSGHGRYLALVDLLRRRDGELAKAFDDLRRSTALIHLLGLRSRGLLTEEEFARFSPESRAVVAAVLEGRR